MSTIAWAFQYGIADGETMRHWLDKSAIVDLAGNEWWSWVHGMYGGNEFGNLLGAPWVGTHCAYLLLMEHIWAQAIGLVRY